MPLGVAALIWFCEKNQNPKLFDCQVSFHIQGVVCVALVHLYINKDIRKSQIVHIYN